MFLTWLVGGAAASERCPIVFAAAMRHDGHPEADGPANLTRGDRRRRPPAGRRDPCCASAAPTTTPAG